MRNNLPFNVMRHANHWEKAPRDPATVGTFILGAAFEGTVAAWVVGYIAITVTTSLIMSVLTPKPDYGSMSGSNGLLINNKSATDPSQVIYGQIRKGGTITFQESTGDNNKVLHQIIVLANHEVEEIGDIYFNDEIVTMSGADVTSEPFSNTYQESYQVYEAYGGNRDGGRNVTRTRTVTKTYAEVYKHTGNQTSKDSPFANSTESLASTLIAATSAGDDFVGKGISYLYCRFTYDQDAYTNGLPTVTAVVKGKKLVKTVNGVEQAPVYTNNPAWVVRDYLTSEYGLDDDSIDDATFEAAAAVSDRTDVLSDGSPQYAVDGVVSLNQPIGDILNHMMTSCAGTLFWGAGHWKLYAGAFITPTKTLTLDDLRSGISLDTKVSSRDNFNKVTGTFIDKSQDWISADYPAVSSDLFLADDNGVETGMDLQLPFTTSSIAAQRLAKQTLYRSREQMSLSADFGLNALDVEVGDFIKFRNERYGWGAGNEKVFEVVGWRLNPDPKNLDLRVNLQLRESSEAAYGFNGDDEKTILSNNTTLLKYYDVPSIGLTVSQEYREVNENVVNVIVVQVNSDDISRVDSVILKYRKDSDDHFKSVGQTLLVNDTGSVGRFEIIGVDAPQINDPAIPYTISVTPVNALGFRGPAVETSYNLTADTTPPASPASLTHLLSGGTIFFDWPSVGDLDLSHYKIYYSGSASANFGDASTLAVVEKVARPATTISYPALSGKFFVTAVDKTGNESTTAATTTVLSSELPSLGASETHTENPSFSGTKSNLTVSGGNLFMTSYDSSGSTGTYNFDHDGADYFDVGTSRTVRLSSALTVSRKHADAVNGEINWDDVPNNWNTWPSNFDTWTDETANFNDFAVVVQARAATTVAGLSAETWVTASGEVIGRYVQFRVILSNTNAKVTPNITALSATVEY